MGLCREHVNNVNTEVTDLESIEKIRTAIFNESDNDKKVCFGGDATVVAIAPYARKDHYSPVPIVLSPSDKTEKGDQLARWIRKSVLDPFAQHPFGQNLIGSIWSLASDGDSTFRRARQIICMQKPLDPLSDLGKKLCGISGLNVYTSIEGITGSCDPKHIFKRMSIKKIFLFDYLLLLRVCNAPPKQFRNYGQ